MNNRKLGGERTYKEAHGDSKEKSKAIYSDEYEKWPCGRFEVAHPKCKLTLLEPLGYEL